MSLNYNVVANANNLEIVEICYIKLENMYDRIVLFELNTIRVAYEL